MTKRYYHASPVRFEKGDIIHPRGENIKRDGRFRWGEVSAYVFLHTEPWLHFTVKSRLSKHDRMYIYEVIPVGPVFYGLEWDEHCTPAPVRVKNLVRAIRAKRKRRAL